MNVMSIDQAVAKLESQRKKYLDNNIDYENITTAYNMAIKSLYGWESVVTAIQESQVLDKDSKKKMLEIITKQLKYIDIKE